MEEVLLRSGGIASMYVWSNSAGAVLLPYMNIVIMMVQCKTFGNLCVVDADIKLIAPPKV